VVTTADTLCDPSPGVLKTQQAIPAFDVIQAWSSTLRLIHETLFSKY